MALGYTRHIKKTIDNLPADKVILTEQIAGGLAAAYGIELSDAKKVTNVSLKRFVDQGYIIRIQKGVYGRPTETPFGPVLPSVATILPELLLTKNNQAIGYEAGPTLLNTIGLCTLIPRKQYIATNRYRSKIPPELGIQPRKPIAPVTQDNALYLQTLEAISAMKRYPVDAEKPDAILRGYIFNAGLDKEKLILYARRHCDMQTLISTIDIVLGG